jgi:serine/threonine protein kinase
MTDKADMPRVFGPYSLLKLLARGGMGEIYLARTQGMTGFEKYYAVKKLLKKFTHDNDVGTRFVDEAKLGARLQHPNIVQVYDLGKINDELYMATEFVDGFDLRRVLRFCHEKKKRIPLDIALFIVREILSGLAYAHRQLDADGRLINLIHRDISPQNVLVSFEGEVKIIDFGLAKSTQRSQETQANVLLGNFGYMSPEQARGQILDVRTDIYSCGIVLFELVTGTKRFVEENPLKLLEMVARPSNIVPSDRVPAAPRAIDRIYSRATAPEKDGRYASAETFRDDVTAALHRLNPRASRENLAQFLNHLFLGGNAPPAVDDDVLNRSVVIVARDLHGGSDAMTSSAADDLKNRSLASDFADTAPQTGSLEVLRAARLGDVLTHDVLVGTAAVAGGAVGANAAPPSATSALSTGAMSSTSAMSGGDPGFQHGQTARLAAPAPLPSSADGAVIVGLEPVVPGPAALFEGSQWPAAPRTGADPFAPMPAPSSSSAPSAVKTTLVTNSEVQRQFDAQLQAQLRAQAQAQLQAQMQAQAQAQLQAQMQAQAQLQAQMQAQAQLQAQMLAQAQAQMKAQMQAQAQLQAQAPVPSPVATTSWSTARAATGQQQGVGLTGPPRALDDVEQVVPGDLVELLDEDVDDMGDPDATIRNPLAAGAPPARSDDSLIIHVSDAPSFDDGVPLGDPPAGAIRPAVRPAAPARPVTSTTTPSLRARRPSEEGPPSTMPPPTRRR